MELQNRFLSQDMTGNDVALLHRELGALAVQFGLTISSEEIERHQFGPDTKAAVEKYQETNQRRLLALSGATGDHWPGVYGVVDFSTAAAINQDYDQLPAPFVVTGLVRDGSGYPLKGARVQAFDQDMRARQPLGKPAITDSTGRFRIEYQLMAFDRSDMGTADLTFEVSSRDVPLQVTGLLQVNDGRLASTGGPMVLFNAAKQAEVVITVNVAATRENDEYTHLLHAIALVTDIQAADFTPEDLTFLTSEFVAVDPEVDREKLMLVVDAERLSRSARQEDADVPAAAFYGLARGGLPLTLMGLAIVAETELLHRLRQAIADRLIPADLGERLEAIVRALLGLAANTLLHAKVEDGKSSLGDVLSAAGLESREQGTVLAAFMAHTGDPLDFWTALRKDATLVNPEKIDSIQYSLQLAWLTQSQTAVLQGIRQAYPNARSLRELFRQLDPARLREITGAEGLAQEMLDLLAASYPTDAVTRLLPSLPSSHFVDAATHAGVSRFFQRAATTDFDLRTSRIDDLLKAHPDLLGGQEGAARTTVINQVKRVQRLFRLSVDSASAGVLLGTGLDSAHEIARVPPASFLTRFGAAFESPEQANLIYDRALTSSAATQLLYTRLFHALNGPHMMSADVAPPEFHEELMRKFPNLSELFGSLEMCECEDCRSVLSPAAYFVDLLEFLSNSTPNAAGVTPLGVLVGDAAKGVLGRRPDLPFIPLTCENTNTRMPFVDLVNEILESYVVFGKLDAAVAKDTGKATEPELSANPQYTISTAYDTVSGAVFPFGLPYDQAVDVLRAYLDHLGSGRYDLLRAVDQRDGTLPPASEQAAEFLGVFPNEFEVLTGNTYGGASSTLITAIPQVYGLSAKELTPVLALGAKGLAVRALQRQLNAAGQVPPLTITGIFDAATQAAVITFQAGLGFPATGIPDAATWNMLGGNDPSSFEVFLSDVPEFLRRTGIEYTDLIELLKTEFVNLGFPLLQFLEDHGISYADVDDLATTGIPNAQILKAVADPAFGMSQAQFIDWIQPRFARLGRFIVLRSGAAECDLSATEIVRLNGKPVGDQEWYLINRFLRLCRRLGWSIRDLDRALLAFGSADIDIALILSLRVTKRLTTLLRLPLAPVLSFWANIETQGPDSLYERLFRSRAMQKMDDSFALNPERRELNVIGQLSDHIPALIAALRVSEADLAQLREATGLADALLIPAPMNLASLSLLYRNAALAAGLRLTIHDLLVLKHIIPFDPLLPNPFGPANTELFVDAALKMKASKFSPGLLRYLYLGEDEVPATFEPRPESVNQLLARLREGLLQISAENTPGEDAHGERTRERLGVLLEPAAADQATRMIDGSAVYTAPLAGLPAAFVFPPALSRRVRYNAAAGLLRLSGVMTVGEQTSLKSLSAGLALPLKMTYEKAIGELFSQPRAFVKDVLGSRGVFLTVPDAEAAIFNAPAADEFGNPTWLDATGKIVAMNPDGTPAVPANPPPVVTAVAAHFRYVLDRLLPFLRSQLSRTLVEKTIGDALQLGPDLPQTLLERAGVLHLNTLLLHPVLEDLLMLEGDGLLGTYFSAPGLVGATQTRVDPAILFDYSSGSTPPGGAVTPFSVRWTGFLLSSTSGVHTFYLRSGGSVRLTVNGVLVIDAFAAPPDAELQGTIALTMGQVCTIQLDFSTTTFGGVIEWRWSSAGISKALVPQAQLYSSLSRASMDAPRQAYRLLYKSALLLNGFTLSASEVQYLAEHAADFDNFDLSALPLVSSLPNPILFTQWSRLYDFAALRDQLPAAEGGLDLTSVMGAAAAGPAAALSAATVDAYRALTGVDLTEAAGVLALTDGGLRTEAGLARIQTLLDLARLTRVTPATLQRWVTTAAHLGPSEEIKRIVKARYDEATWPVVARPLNDVLRDHQRTSLVSYLLPRLGLENSNQLYELLLIDVEMGTCMNTSRIVQAVAAVQLFVQRCLLGVEDGVAVSAIDPRRWDWMSSYRLWEANRQVYLFPENWLEPALRDDKSPFFKELESDLLQSDLTTASAEDSFLNYLYKLDEVARLDLVGLCLQDKSAGNLTDDVVHLFGRTIHNPHRYFYRSRINNATWTPWERIPVDIEGVEKGEQSGVHLIPIVWDRRVYLFWPQFLEHTDDKQDFTQTESAEHKDWRKHHDLWEKNMVIYREGYAKWDANRIAWEKVHNVHGVSEFYPVPPPPAPPEPKEPQDDTSIQRPRKFLDISIAWTEYQGGGRWSPKQTTSQSLRCTNLDRRSYIFQAVPLFDGTLSISFLTHPVTDDRWVHDPKNPRFVQEILVIDSGIDSGEFLFTGCQGDIETNLRYLGALNGRLGIVMPDATEQDYMRFEQKSSPGLVLNIGDYLSLNVRVLGDVLIQKYRNPLKVLAKTPPISKTDSRLSRFRLLYPHQLPQFVGQAQFCYQDDLRDYFVTPDLRSRFLERGALSMLSARMISTAEDRIPAVPTVMESKSARLDQPGALLIDQPWTTKVSRGIEIRPRMDRYFLFEPLFHPYACTFVETLRRGGIDALLSPDLQGLSDAPRLILAGGTTVTNFERIYAPTPSVLLPYPLEDVDFTSNGSYSLYNWELFFYAPLLVADSLSQNQRFDEARQWFHFIFDPMTKGGGAKPARYWNFLPFKDVESDRLAEMMLLLSMPDGVLTAAQKAKKYGYAQQWQLLKDNPFRPYVVARLRPLAFMKNVVMKYIDNLIRWGDQLFAQDTRESINEATQLYVLASELLGPIVQKTPRRGRVAPETYDSLKKKQLGGKLDPFSNGLVFLEQEFPFSTGLATGAGPSTASGPVIGDTLYFCIPQNRQLLGYWDTVADRLFKIRNCLNISGIERELPLFAPRIDPGILVSAVAHGVDLKTVLNDLNTPAPLYRFSTVYQKALDFCNDVKGFGAAFLAALEKRDAEELALMRASQEASLLNLVKEVKTQQLLEAQAAKGALDASAEVITRRQEYYANLPDRIAYEATQVSELDTAQRLLNDGQVSEQFASMIASYLPDTSIGTSGNGAHFTATFGRGNLIAQYQSVAHEKSFLAGQHTHASGMAATLGTWLRRRTDWKFQADQAERELDQVNKQIETAKIRIAIAQRELLNHEQQTEDAQRVETFLRDKFTNADLCAWMTQQMSRIYFQSYQLAFDMARKAEKAYRFELGLTTSNCVQYGYWDDLHKGLTAGEQLHLALRQMECSYLDQNRRTYEITRHISLLLHDPVALMNLKQTGTCEIELPEAFFDADYPGHYMRRIKTVSLTIPAVVGPYTSINCTLTLLTNKTRVKPIVGDSYVERLDTEDDRFVSNFASIQSIATSSGQNDSGLFELNFRDERYLPFEGAGCISTWKLECLKDNNAFDFETISDVVLTLRYTALEAGVMLRKAASAALETTMADQSLLAQSRLISLRHEFPNEWARFLSPTDATAAKQELTVSLPTERFSFRYRGWQMHIREVEVLMPLRDFRDASGLPLINALNEYKGKPLDVGLAFLAPNDAVIVSTVDTLNSSRGILDGTPYLHWAFAPQDVPVRLHLEVMETAVKALKPSLQITVPPPTGRKRLKAEAIEDVIVILHFNADR